EGKWDGMAWGFQSGHAVGLDERTYVYMHSKSTKNFFRVNDPVIDELTVKLRQAPDRADQRTTARRSVDRETRCCECGALTARPSCSSSRISETRPAASCAAPSAMARRP